MLICWLLRAISAILLVFMYVIAIRELAGSRITFYHRGTTHAKTSYGTRHLLRYASRSIT